MARVDGPDGDWISLWDISTGVRILDLPGVGVRIVDLAFAPGGDRLVSLDDRGSLAIWKIPDGLSGSAFEIACRHLPDADLSEAVAGYPIVIDEPICGPAYNPPLPEKPEAVATPN